MLTDKFFDSGTVALHYVEGPAGGKPLLLLHGVTTWWQTFLPILPAFMNHYHVYALDLRGHGGSGRVPGAYSINDDVADVVAFLRACVQEAAIVLGWSLGGMVATFVAAEAPELVTALVLEDLPLAALTYDDAIMDGFYEYFALLHDALTQSESVHEKRAALAAMSPEEDEEELHNRLKMYEGFDPESLVVLMEKRKFEQRRLEELLPRITCPVLLIQADLALGAALDDPNVEAAQRLLADCTHVKVEDVGHGIHGEKPVIFSQIVMDYLESV